MKMNKGNCYEANFKEMCLTNAINYGDNWRLVHAMREIMQGSEWFGGHAFLLNVDTNEVHDFSNGNHVVANKEDYYKEWNILEHGQQTYYEYTKAEAWKWATKTEHYGCWELKFEMWDTEGWNEYMTTYGIPTHEPRRHALNLMSKRMEEE
jgi:imidazole glycerol phosphate synthase subunit HisF